MIFRREPLAEIIAYLRGHDRIRVPDPDRGKGRYAGEALANGDVHRPLRAWVDLAERLDLRLCTPRDCGDGLVELVFERLDAGAAPAVGEGTEKYGATTDFARINKLEDPCFVIDFAEALERARRDRAIASVLVLGVNRGDELAAIYAQLPDARIVGVDHSASALAVARGRFPQAAFVEADLARPRDLGEHDLVVSINTRFDDRELLRRIVQEHARHAVIFGVPNCRYLDGEQRFGARTKNFTQPELGLLVKDVAFYRKYLAQHRMQVYVTGKHYILVCGVSIRT